MTSESPYGTVTAAAIQCSNCGTTRVGLVHGDAGCQGGVVVVDDGWRCGSCGVPITSEPVCPSCGADGAAEAVGAIVDPRPETAVSAVEATIQDRIARTLPGTIAVDDELRTVMRSHCHEVVEHEYFEGGKRHSLGSRLEAVVPSLGAYAVREATRALPDRTPDQIAECLLDEFDGEFLTEGKNWTHLAVGASFTPNGGIHVATVLATRSATPDPAALEQAVHQTVNERRRSHGLDPLADAPHLAAIARSHSREMARRDFFAHETPDGDGPSDRYERHGHAPRPSGENIAKRHPTVGQDATEIAAGVVSSWMESPGHRENLLASHWSAEGIGVYPADDGAVLVTENFR